MKKITLHQDYESETHRNDLAILEIDPVQFGRTIRPICLPDREEKDLEGVEGIIVGFGLTNSLGDFPEQLMQAKVQILSNAECKQRFEKRHLQLFSDRIFDTSLCALGDGKNGSCPGRIHICACSLRAKKGNLNCPN